MTVGTSLVRVVTLSFLMAGATPSEAQQSVWLTVARVIDGNMFVLSSGETVRLIGIDAPETYQSQKLERDAERAGHDEATIQTLGCLASDYARDPVEGERLELEQDPANAVSGHEDRYGRTLAYVWVVRAEGGDRAFMVNQMLVAEGYARVYLRFPFARANEFQMFELLARMEGNGLWDEGLGMMKPAPLEGAAVEPDADSVNVDAAPGSKLRPEEDKDCSDFATHAEAQAFSEAIKREAVWAGTFRISIRTASMATATG